MFYVFKAAQHLGVTTLPVILQRVLGSVACVQMAPRVPTVLLGFISILDPVAVCNHKCKLDMSTARRRLKSPRSLSSTSAHPIMVTLVNIMVMNGWLRFYSFHVNRPPHSWNKAISDSDLKLQGQGHGCGQRARSYNRPSIIWTHFLFISHQSEQQFLR